MTRNLVGLFCLALLLLAVGVVALVAGPAAAGIVGLILATLGAIESGAGRRRVTTPPPKAT